SQLSSKSAPTVLAGMNRTSTAGSQIPARGVRNASLMRSSEIRVPGSHRKGTTNKALDLIAGRTRLRPNYYKRLSVSFPIVSNSTVERKRAALSQMSAASCRDEAGDNERN